MQFSELEKKPVDFSYPFVFRADTGDAPPVSDPRK